MIRGKLRGAMLAHDGILHTISSALAQELLEKNDAPESRSEILGLVLAQGPNPTQYAIETAGLLRVDMKGVEMEWDRADIQTHVDVEVAREMQDFQSTNIGQLCFFRER